MSEVGWGGGGKLSLVFGPFLGEAKECASHSFLTVEHTLYNIVMVFTP